MLNLLSKPLSQICFSTLKIYEMIILLTLVSELSVVVREIVDSVVNKFNAFKNIRLCFLFEPRLGKTKMHSLFDLVIYFKIFKLNVAVIHILLTVGFLQNVKCFSEYSLTEIECPWTH